jgi:hypothetical protein
MHLHGGEEPGDWLERLFDAVVASPICVPQIWLDHDRATLDTSLPEAACGGGALAG